MVSEKQLLKAMKLGRFLFILSVIYYFLTSVMAFAATIQLVNGDILHGDLVSEDTSSIVLESEIFGPLNIEKGNVKKITDHKLARAIVAKLEKPAAESHWAHKVSIGYTLKSGATDEQDLMGEVKTEWKDETKRFMLRGRIDYGETGERVDTQNWIIVNRDSYTFWRAGERRLDAPWYGSVKPVKLDGFFNVELDHDRFSDIDWRLVPTVGVAYWLSENDATHLHLDVGVGMTHTKFESGKSGETDPTIIPSLHLKQGLWGKSSLEETFTFYPSWRHTDEYRYVSETKFINPITDALSLDLSLIHEFDNTGAGGTEKYDNKFISSLSYIF